MICILIRYEAVGCYREQRRTLCTILVQVWVNGDCNGCVDRMLFSTIGIPICYLIVYISVYVCWKIIYKLNCQCSQILKKFAKNIAQSSNNNHTVERSRKTCDVEVNLSNEPLLDSTTTVPRYGIIQLWGSLWTLYLITLNFMYQLCLIAVYINVWWVMYFNFLTVYV